MTAKQKQELGQELKSIRLKEGLSLRKIAVKMGLGVNNCLSISRIEDGNFDSPELPKSYLLAMGFQLKEKYSYKIVKKI